MTNPCTSAACDTCPLLGLCGDPMDRPDVDPNEPTPEGGCCGGGCCG